MMGGRELRTEGLGRRFGGLVAARAGGRDPGPLAGLCVAVKENIDTVPATLERKAARGRLAGQVAQIAQGWPAESLVDGSGRGLRCDSDRAWRWRAP